MPCIKIDKPLVIYRFWKHYEMTPITSYNLAKNVIIKYLNFSYDKHESNIRACISFNLFNLLRKR